MEYKIGDQVIFERYGLKLGRITRVGDKTASVESGYGYIEKMVEYKYIYPATPENVGMLQQIESLAKEIERFTTPLEIEMDQLRVKIRKTRQV